ncbi:MAG TPA: T9SS type A sorting domain-containing protein, partial [Bacteroidia bacterium]|nr:T9SS type A sorting domain-containing protein [Bacteroidia bacterium]
AGGGYSGDGGQATAAELDGPQAVVFDKNGNMYIAEYGNNIIRMVSTLGVISTVAGNQFAGPGYSGDGGQATAAELDRPAGIAFDGAGNMYISDGQNDVIRKVNTSGVISTFAGTYPGGNFSGDGGQATAAELNYPIGIIIDGLGYVYIADQDNHVVRMINPSGIITTVAGNNAAGNGYSGDGGPATAAELSFPTGICLDASKLLYIADESNAIIRKVSAPLAVNEVQANNSMLVYPNPASNMVYIQLNGVNGKVNLSLYNMIGQQVITKSTETNKNMNFSVEGLPEGTYLLRVQCEDGSTIISKIEVTR